MVPAAVREVVLPVKIVNIARIALKMAARAVFVDDLVYGRTPTKFHPSYKVLVLLKRNVDGEKE